MAEYKDTPAPSPSSGPNKEIVELSILAFLILLCVVGVAFFLVPDKRAVLAGILLIVLGWAAERMRVRLKRRAGRAKEDYLSETVRLLMEKNERLVTEKERVESALNTATDPFVAKMIIERKLRDEKRAVTVLFADIEGFTSSAEDAPPETIISQLNRIFNDIEPIITNFKGHIDKYVGDGLMAEFGAPQSAHNHPLLAVLAALRIQETLKHRDLPWKMRIGIASGTLLVGLLGSQRRRNYTAIGDTVNLASRLQAVCPTGSVCVDESVFRFIQRWFDCSRIRAGMSKRVARELEKRLQDLQNVINRCPTAKLFMDAADVSLELGNTSQALRYQRMAIELDPTQFIPLEKDLSARLIQKEDRAFVTVKGKKNRVAAYEVAGIRDFFEDRIRLPERVMHVYRWLESELKLPQEWMLSLEALEGRMGHAQVTAALSGALAEAIGLDDKQVKQAFLAGYFNDVGKLRVPEHLLCYEGRIADLPEPDQALIKSHVSEAERVLAELEPDCGPEVLQAIVQHHERFDGNGYPNGLKGDGICLPGRIVRIADTYEALTSWRIYQDALTPQAALIEFCRDIDAGAIDPRLGKAFLNMMCFVPMVQGGELARGPGAA